MSTINYEVRYRKALKACTENREIWRDVLDYEGLYRISNFGRVKSLARMGGGNYTQFRPERILKPGYALGYLHVVLCKEGKTKLVKVHRLVAKAFIPNPEHKETVNHLDGIKDNNRVDNIEWATVKENTHHAMRIGLLDNKGENNPAAILTNEQVLEIYGRRKEEKYAWEVAEEYGVEGYIVRDIWGGYSWTSVTGATEGNKDWRFYRGHQAGEKNGMAKTTEVEVREIRRLFDTGCWTRKQLAEKFGKPCHTIKQIIARVTWKHVV